MAATKKVVQLLLSAMFFCFGLTSTNNKGRHRYQEMVSPGLFREVSSLILTPYLFKRSNTSFSCMRSSYVKDDTISTQSEDEWDEEQYRNRNYPIILFHCQGKKL